MQRKSVQKSSERVALERGIVLGLLRVLGLLWLGAFLNTSASAQIPLELDDQCTVTVGNQTAIVSPDGGFRVRNIAVFQTRDTGVAPQLFRVRATCLRNGELITGQSEFFSLTPRQTSLIADVFPTDLDPIPVSILVTGPSTLLPSDVSLQLTVMATLPDRSTEDVTPRSQGSTYLSTNPSLLTVTEDGLVTGRNRTSRPRTGTIVVLNEGNLGTINFTTVGPSNDLDNDGMTNDFEELYGLNPLANDAGLDLDGDGLTNLEEFELGTSPISPDTDADGIPDNIDASPLHPEESPPSITITNPSSAIPLIEGQMVTFSADVTDDGFLTGVELSTSNFFSQMFTVPPFTAKVLVPFGVPEMTFTVRATDLVPNQSEDSLVIAVIPDPGTTAQGRVEFQNLPVEAAEVIVFDQNTTTDVAGDFTLPGVFSVRGPIIARASFTAPSTNPMVTFAGPSPALTNGSFLGASSPMEPVAGGVTDVGTIRLRKVKFDTFPGASIRLGDDRFQSVLFLNGFTFPFAGKVWTEVYVNANGNLTFGDGDRTFDPAIPEGVVNGLPRISGLFTDLIPLREVFVKSLADRFVATWVRVPQFGAQGQNSFQIKLFTDGTVQIGYAGITADGFGDGAGNDTLDVSVGLSQGMTPNVVSADFSAGTPAAIGFGDAFFENFNTDDSFDLSGAFLLFIPNGLGGFNSVVLPTVAFSSSVTTKGPVIDESGNRLSGALVVARIGGPNGRIAQTITDNEGCFKFENLRTGELIEAEAFFEGRFVARGAVRLMGSHRGEQRTFIMPVRPSPIDKKTPSRRNSGK